MKVTSEKLKFNKVENVRHYPRSDKMSTETTAGIVNLGGGDSW